MQISNNGELLISINGKTKLLSKEEIVRLYNQGIAIASESNTVTNNTNFKTDIESNQLHKLIKKVKEEHNKPSLINTYYVGIDYFAKDYPYFVSHTADNYPNSVQEEVTAPAHYNNEKGSLYEFCERNSVNSYEFDIIKRVIRCRKKGLFKEDLEKTKFLIDLYLKEYTNEG
jgi:hypothetical protein